MADGVQGQQAAANLQRLEHLDHILRRIEIDQSTSLEAILHLRSFAAAHDRTQPNRKDLLLQPMTGQKQGNKPVGDCSAEPLIDTTRLKIGDRLKESAPGQELTVAGFEFVER
ncbi:hypothetical protein FHX08_004149 [Rhizobium sp. BK529]|uniref:hypothetical protein n=1 Tax=unclassified Rhizobium TaxID=2613769 RepID=UPI0014056145|nr:MULTISPECIES: hypothetical protein [unclassified Rhizobium]MBB3593746.1 hypothetical protein [Rhizobium sp. BK529]